MKVLQINTFGNLSTGKIAVDIYRTLRAHGSDGAVAFARNEVPGDVPSFKIGNPLSVYTDGVFTRLTDKAGHYSKGATEKLIKQIKEYDPDIIFTHHPFDTHQAHAGVSNATIAAARRRNTVFFYEPIQPSGRSYVAFKPVLYVDIEDTIEQKIESLKCHTSEYNKFGAEDWIEGVRCRCGFRGYEIGKKFAEAFEEE